MRESLSGSEVSGRRWAGRFAALGAVVCAMVVLFGTVAASPVASALVTQRYVAPYAGTESDLVFGQPVGCGNTMTLSALPYFNMSSGIGYTSARSTSVPCQGANSSNTVNPMFGLFTNGFAAPTGGTFHFKETWVLSFSVKLSVKPGTTSGSPYAFFYVYPTAQVENVSGGFWSQNYSTTLTYAVFSGSYSHTYSNVRMTVWLNATLPVNATDTYTYFTWMNVVLATGAPVGTQATSASLNMATNGHHATLSYYSVRVT